MIILVAAMMKHAQRRMHNMLIMTVKQLFCLDINQEEVFKM